MEGKPALDTCLKIDLEKIESRLRLQEIIFKTTARIYEAMQSAWKNKGTPYSLIGQVFRWVEKYLVSDTIRIEPSRFSNDPLRVRILFMLNMNRIVEHLWDFITVQETTALIPLFDPNKKVRSTGDMSSWWTSKPCVITKKSHISHCVYDSTWEAAEAYRIEKNSQVIAWAKNDHLGFGIKYTFGGITHTFSSNLKTVQSLCLKQKDRTALKFRQNAGSSPNG